MIWTALARTSGRLEVNPPERNSGSAFTFTLTAAMARPGCLQDAHQSSSASWAS